jgi:hypothetical protein
MTIEGATDTEVFRVYVSQVLCATLRPGEVVVMDNLSPHKSEPTLSLIAQAGAQILFLPASSPDLNPIVKMWSKVKAFLRSGSGKKRSLQKPGIGPEVPIDYTNDPKILISFCDCRKPSGDDCINRRDQSLGPGTGALGSGAAIPACQAAIPGVRC